MTDRVTIAGVQVNSGGRRHAGLLSVSDCTESSNIELEIAAQGVAQYKVSATRVVADAALRRIG